MTELFQALKEAVSSQFFAGGAAVVLLGGIMALCRKVPWTLWLWLRRQCTVTVDVMNSDISFEWLMSWLDAHPYSQRATRLTLSTKGSLTEEGARQVIFTPAPGNHLFFYRGRLVQLIRERNASSAGKDDDDAGGMMGLRQRETITLRILGRKQDVVRQLIEDARRMAEKAAKKKAELFASGSWCWMSIGELTPRRMESVILPEGQAERIRAKVVEFLESRQWYLERGIPYRLGVMFEGAPGSGKSSIIRALASEMNLNLYMLNIGSPSLSDERLSSLMAEIKDHSILLLEDIDAAVRGRMVGEAGQNPGDTKGITFSGLLNALDGVNAREGIMVFMTTNHKERLDPALIRPGRVDVMEHFTHATPAQAARLFSNFYPGHKPGLAQAFACVTPATATMAELQQHLLNYKRDPGRAVSVLTESGLSAAA